MSTFKTQLILYLCVAQMLCACTGRIEDPREDLEMTTPEVSDPPTSSSGERGRAGEAPSSTDPLEATPSEETSNPTTEDPAEPVTEPVIEPVSEPEEEATPDPRSQLEREELADPQEGEGVHVALIPPAILEPLNRPRRRLNLDQLSQAIEQTMGGLIWSEVVNGEERDLFVTMAATLGKPDFIQRTTEDLTPSALFQKFLGDASRQVCQRRAQIDLDAMADPRAELSDPKITLWGALSPELTPLEDESAIEGQIRALVLRFHSRVLPEGPSPRLTYWRWLFDTAMLVDGSPVSGWRALCVGLINHPDFYSY